MTDTTSKIKADIEATTGKMTGFLADKVDDAKYRMEAKQRKRDISGESNAFDRTKDNVKGWFDNEVRPKAEETKEGFQQMTGLGNNNNEPQNRNENKGRNVGEGDTGCGTDTLQCCGVFST